MAEYDKVLAFWQDKKITNDADLSEVLNGHSILFAYHSGKIENDLVTYHDTREIFERDGVTSYTGDLRTLFELSNAKDAYELMLVSFRDRVPMDETLVKKFQKVLTQKTYDTRRWQLGERPGEYKKHDYVTGLHEIGALPEDVQEEMQELMTDLQDIPDEKALTAAAFFHAKMENIHPFADGNGRTGRLMMNYYLILHNHPPVIIYEEDRKSYYSALESFDTDQDLAPLLTFLKEETVKTWKKRI